MSTPEIIQELTQAIVRSGRVYNSRVSGGQQLVTRCPFCGDSEIKSHTHFYIQTVVGKPLLYNCFRCPAQGVITRETLYDLGLDSFSLGRKITEANKEIQRATRRNTVTSSNSTSSVLIPEIVLNDQSIPKIVYLTKRVDVRLDSKLINDFKVITDLNSFVSSNKLDLSFVKKRMLDTLHTGYLGFLSNDKNFITFRNITDQDLVGRYYDLCLTQDEVGSSRKFFNITNQVDPMCTTLKLNICEGAIDAIGLYNYNGMVKSSNEVYIGATGKNFNAPINHFIRSGFLNLELNFFLDNDVSVSKLKNTLDCNRLLKSIDSTVNVFYNNADHDFGVPKENITLRRVSYK